MHDWLTSSGYILAATSFIYSVLAWLAVRTTSRSVRCAATSQPRVTILKPLCGVERETYECLRSFCAQRYPEFQIVFGVCSDTDPAIPVVQRLQREFPRLDLELVVDRRQHGSSRKVSNLINMMSLARHDFLVLSDSDVRVESDYLGRIVAPLLDESVGIVTCTYRGISRGGLWSLLGSLFINDWFMPSVRVAGLTGSRSFASGATIAMRRHVLASIGGLAMVANQLADDYRLGQLIRRTGLRTVVSDVVVETFVVERNFSDLVHHELRWLRTIRALQPLGYGFSFVTFGMPVTALGALLARGAPPTLGLLAASALARLMLHLSTRQRDTRLSTLLVLPLRDALTLALWTWSFATRRVRWREDRYRVTRDGSVLPV